jgi:hypothetical protein
MSKRHRRNGWRWPTLERLRLHSHAGAWERWADVVSPLWSMGTLERWGDGPMWFAHSGAWERWSVGAIGRCSFPTLEHGNVGAMGRCGFPTLEGGSYRLKGQSLQKPLTAIPLILFPCSGVEAPKLNRHPPTGGPP